MNRLIFGCGYLGLPTARFWLGHGDTVYAVTRSRERSRELESAGVRPIIGDVGQPGSLPALPLADTVLWAVGFDRTGGGSLRNVYVDALAGVLDTLAPSTGRVVYISTTGVYGSGGDGWIDEDSPCQPERETASASLEAEQLLAAHPLGDRAVVLRMAGLYGPGRLPYLADVRAGRPLERSPEGYLNLIHVDDAAAVIDAASRRAPVPRTYVVSDGSPVLRRDYYRELARLLKAPEPTFAAPQESPSDSDKSTRRGSGSKRVHNARMMRELGVTLRYPTYREGLTAIVSAEE
jgi:nucleoside-diphosphate-sugar epimerase